MNHPKLIAAMLIPILLTSCLTLEVTEGEIDGTITGYSEAGDAITDIGYDVVIASGFSYGDMVSIASGEYTSSMPLCSSAGDVDAGSPAAVLDEEDGLSIMIRDGSFQESSGLEEGAEIAMTISEEGGYLEEYSRRNLIRMEDRDYYESDEAYADFRAVIPGILYRLKSIILLAAVDKRKIKRPHIFHLVQSPALIDYCVTSAEHPTPPSFLYISEFFHFPKV